MDGRFWLTEGRGSYAWDDDRYREEFREAACEILAALRPMREMAANLSSRLKTTDEIVQARIDTKKRISQLEAELAAAKNETDQVTALYDECHDKFVLAENEIARLNGEVQRFDHERDALAAHVERLREAAELAECYMKVLRHELAQNNANFEGSEDEAEINGDFAKVQSALATAPAQSLAAHDAALLRRLAAESAPGERADIAPWLLAEAARLRAREGK